MPLRDRIASNTPITIQGHVFHSDLFVLGLSGADIVLGVQWLQELGPIVTDYTSRTMPFTWLGAPVQLTADVPLLPAPASVHQFHRLVHTQGVTALFQLTHMPDPHPPTINSSPSDTPPAILPILYRYGHLFQEPSTLPPPRPISHHIHLQPNFGIL